MIVKLSVEEELKLERSVRELQSYVADEKVGHLCGSLLKQSYFHQQLIRQAVHHIATLELERELSRYPHTRKRLIIRALRMLFRKTIGMCSKVTGRTNQ